MVVKIIHKGITKDVLIDDEDAYLFDKYKWYIDIDGYLIHGKTVKSKNTKRIRLHRVIMNPPDGIFVDHKNGNTLDNRRSNLRFATRSQNSMNSKLNTRNILKLKGVSARGNKFFASIRLNRRKIYLGTFDTAQEAHAAYCEASKKYHGEFGRTE